MNIDLKSIQEKAKSGDGLSAYILGRAYYSSELGLKTNYAKSFEYYSYGYKQLNDPRCEYGYAMFYFDDGESESEGVVEKDNEYANKLFAEAYPKLVELAKNGDMYSNFILGAYHNYGIGGIKKDFSIAIKFIQQSANLGHSGACYDMGKFYAEGKGVKRNLEEAKKYFEKASKLGNVRAEAYLERSKMKDILDFLIEAKKNTYANGKALRTKPLRQGSSDYHFEGKIGDAKAIYHDTYFGSKKFIGEEVVYLDSEKPFWGMNYYGYSLNDDEYENAIAKVLRPALMQVGIDKNILPLRGPSKFVNSDYIYTFECNGTIDKFTGVEKIYKNNELIYELNCHGGIIK